MDWGLTPNNACWSNWLAVHRRSLPHRLGFVAGGFTFLYRVEGWRIYSSFCLKLTFSFWGETPSFQGELAVSFRECSKSEVSTVNTFILLLVVMMHHALRRKFHVWITCFFCLSTTGVVATEMIYWLYVRVCFFGSLRVVFFTYRCCWGFKLWFSFHSNLF